MSGSRTKNSFRNIFVNIGCQIITNLFSFFTRTLFIKLLGSDYLGLNSLFTNILSVLSIAELGIDTAIVYNLYKYLAKDNKNKIAANINFFRDIYRYIALIIFILGIAVIPFLPKIINLKNNISHINLYYFIFLLNSVFSYLFVYKSAILNADQKNYIVRSTRTVFFILLNIFQLLFLYFTHNYLIYLLIQLFFGILINITLYIISEKQYPYLKNNKAKLSLEEKTYIFNNVKSLFLYGIGGILLQNSTNIIISIIVGTTVVGYYSNYMLLFGFVLTISSLIFGGMQASIGNYVSLNNNKENMFLFYVLNFANFWIYCLCSVLLFAIMDDFIYLWIGSEYVLGKLTSLLISLIVFIPSMQTAVTSLRTVTGLFKETKYIIIITAFLNILFSVIFGKIWGLNGILVSLILSRLLTNIWFEPYLLFKKIFKSSIKYYLFNMLKYYFITFLLLFLTYIIKCKFIISTWYSFLLEIIISILAVNIILLILFYKRKEFKYILQRIKYLKN